MMRKLIRIAAAAATALLLTPSPAGASASGTLYVDPFDGVDLSRNNVITSGPCPEGENIVTRIFGKGFPVAGQIMQINSPIAQYRRTAAGGLIVPLGDTFRSFADRQSPPVTFNGDYRITVSCIHKLIPGKSLADFSGTVRFTSPTAYKFMGVRPSVPPVASTLPADSDPGALPEVPVASSSPQPTSLAARLVDPGNVWILVLGGLALIAIFGGVVYYRRKPGGLTFD